MKDDYDKLPGAAKGQALPRELRRPTAIRRALRYGSRVNSRQSAWETHDPPNVFAGLEMIGTAACPLLAGFSATTIVLLVDAHSKPNDPGFAREPYLAVSVLVIAVICFLFALQATMWARAYRFTPADARDWFPDDAPASSRRNPRPSGLSGVEVYRRRYQRRLLRYERLWAKRARRLYLLGVFSFFAGMAIALSPREGGNESLWFAAGLFAAAAVLEILWLVYPLVDGWLAGKPIAAGTGDEDGYRDSEGFEDWFATRERRWNEAFRSISGLRVTDFFNRLLGARRGAPASGVGKSTAPDNAALAEKVAASDH